MHSNRKNKQDQVKISNTSDRRIVTVRDQEISNKTGTKTRSTSEVIERREAKKSINRTKGYTMVMLQKEIN